MHIEVGKTLDVEVVERQLAQLWEKTAASDADEAAAVLRARVANLLVYAMNEEHIEEVRELLMDLTARHPSRLLLMLGLLDAEDRDIEMSVESHCQTDKRTGAKRLCCEEVALRAQGKFVRELPSAALPLLVADLSTFLWWRTTPHVQNKALRTLLRGSDRLVFDSGEFAEPMRDLVEVSQLYSDEQFSDLGISDLNWARLTLWRGLLADFYDVPAFQPWLQQVSKLRIEYTAPENAPHSCAPQALFITGWFAGRLGWTLSSGDVKSGEPTHAIDFAQQGGHAIRVELHRVESEGRQPGKLMRVELSSEADNESPAATFIVSRSEDNLHIISETRLGSVTHRGRVLPVRNRSTAHLLSREMEILCNDDIYQEALTIAAKLIAK